MQNPSTFSKHHTEEDSYLDISDSCVRSDIADLISKMYTPLQEIPRTSVTASSTMNTVDREMICQKGQSSNNRFGFHFYAVETRKDFRIKVDSSESDSVSLPKIKKKLKRSRYVCECCKRQSWKYVPKERIRCGCGNVKTTETPKCLKLEDTTKPLQVEDGLLVFRGQGDAVKQKYSNNINCHSICKANGNCKSAPAIIPCTQMFCQKQSPFTCDKGNVSDEKECLQIVPDIAVPIDTCWDHENPNPNPVHNEDFKTPPTSVLKRFVRGLSSWSEVFRRSTPVNSNQVRKENLSNLEDVVSKDVRNQETADLISCHCKIPQLKNDSQNRFKRKRGYQNLLRNPEKIDYILCRERKGQSNQNLSDEVPMESNVINIEPKLSKFTSTSQDKGNEYKSGVIKSSSVESILSQLNTFHREERSKEDANPRNSEYVEGKTENLKQISVGEEESRPLYHPRPLSPKLVCVDCVNCRYKKHRHTAESCPLLHTDLMIDRADAWATKFWARVFRPCHVLLAFFTAFFLQFLRFMLRSLVEPLLWGTVQIGSDYFFQPCLRVLYSSIIQPVFMFFQNIASSISDLCLPIAQCFGLFFREFADICRACRLVEIHKTNNVYGESRDHERTPF